MADIEPHELPQLLAPVARHLAELHNTSDAFKKAEGFQKLYLNVLQAGLQSRPTVLLVDDVVLADAVSVSILVALGQDEFLTNTGLFNMGRSSRPIVQQQDNRRRFAIIMTTGAKQLHYCPINISQSTECNMLDLMEDPDVSILELLPLKGDGIEALALQVLCGGSPSELRLDPTMLEILVGMSHVPSMCMTSECCVSTCVKLFASDDTFSADYFKSHPSAPEAYTLLCCSAPARQIGRGAPARPGAHLVA